MDWGFITHLFELAVDLRAVLVVLHWGVEEATLAFELDFDLLGLGCGCLRMRMVSSGQKWNQGSSYLGLVNILRFVFGSLGFALSFCVLLPRKRENVSKRGRVVKKREELTRVWL